MWVLGISGFRGLVPDLAGALADGLGLKGLGFLLKGSTGAPLKGSIVLGLGLWLKTGSISIRG